MSSIVLAKMRGSAAQFRRLFADDEQQTVALEVPEGIEHAVKYNPTEVLESKDQLMYVDLDPEQHEKMIGPYLDGLSMGTDVVAQPEYADVATLIKVTGRKMVFSRIPSGSRVHEHGKKMLVFGDEGAHLETVSFAVEFSGSVDAYYDGAERIYFTSFAKAKPLFKDFQEFFQEAWYEENEDFLNCGLFSISEIGVDDVGPSETKIIAELKAKENLRLDDPQVVAKIQAYARKYPLAGVAVYPDGKLRISSKEDLKCVLKLLSEKFYTSEITGDLLEAKNLAKMKSQIKTEPSRTQREAEDDGDIVG